MTSSSNRRGAAKTTLPWTTAEEITLCIAGCNAMDTYVTRDIHSRKGLWEEVFANFEKDMGGTIRGYDAIVSKWKNSILPKVAAFSVVYDGVQRHRWRRTDFDRFFLFQNALAEYQNDGKKLDEMRYVHIYKEKYQQLLLMKQLSRNIRRRSESEKSNIAMYDKEWRVSDAQQAHDEVIQDGMGGSEI
ncbi:hypothetical protein Tco_0864977 [Tanacetum coccineum]